MPFHTRSLDGVGLPPNLRTSCWRNARVSSSGATHCGGAGMSTNLLFDALVKWVENGIAPDYLIAQVNATRTRKVCMYPNTPAYIGGSTDDQASFACRGLNRDRASPGQLLPARGSHN